MKTLPAGLQAHLDTGTTTLCFCWRLQRTDGQVFGFTNHDHQLVFAGTTYSPGTGFSPSEISAGLGLAVDTMEVAGALSSDAIREADIALGLWDNAAAEIWRVNWADVAQRVILRKGSIGEVSRGPLAFQAEIRGLAHQLNQEMGRTYSRPCDAVLGDARCGVILDAAEFKGNGAVTTAADDRFLTVSGLSGFADEWFSLGLLTWTSGANAGGAVEVASHFKSGSTVTLQLWRRAALAVAAGDAFTVTAGCDKTFAQCRGKFDNTANHRGFPHIPGNDSVMQFAGRKSENDGGSFFNG